MPIQNIGLVPDTRTPRRAWARPEVPALWASRNGATPHRGLTAPATQSDGPSGPKKGSDTAALSCLAHVFIGENRAKKDLVENLPMAARIGAIGPRERGLGG